MAVRWGGAKMADMCVRARQPASKGDSSINVFERSKLQRLMDLARDRRDGNPGALHGAPRPASPGMGQ